MIALYKVKFSYTNVSSCHWLIVAFLIVTNLNKFPNVDLLCVITVIYGHLKNNKDACMVLKF